MARESGNLSELDYRSEPVLRDEYGITLAGVGDCLRRYCGAELSLKQRAANGLQFMQDQLAEEKRAAIQELERLKALNDGLDHLAEIIMADHAQREADARYEGNTELWPPLLHYPDFPYQSYGWLVEQWASHVERTVWEEYGEAQSTREEMAYRLGIDINADSAEANEG